MSEAVKAFMAAAAFSAIIIGGFTILASDAAAYRRAFHAVCIDDAGGHYTQAYRGSDLITRDAEGYVLQKLPAGFRCKAAQSFPERSGNVG